MQLLSHGLVAPTQRTVPDFELRRPRTAAEAVTAGAEPGAVYAMGCTDLFAQFREGLDCATLVSLDRIPGLDAVRLDDGTLRIGAGAVHHIGARDPAVVAALPGLAAGWRQVATERIRQRATIGGNIMARRPRYELAIMCDSLGAELSFLTPNGSSLLSIADVQDGRVPSGALLLSVNIPSVRGAWFGYERSMRPLLTVAATVRGDSVRVSVGSESRPHFTVTAPAGTPPAGIAAQFPDQIGDDVAGADYRRHVAGVLLGRLLAARSASGETR